MDKKIKLAILRWIVIIVLLGFALAQLNYAFYAAWAGSGPPNNYPEAWKYLSIKSLCFSISLAIASVFAFLTIGKEIKKFRIVFISLLVIAFGSAIIYPYGYKQKNIDSCLDSGGSWEDSTFKCLK